jgi:acid phosphatase (class A)
MAPTARRQISVSIIVVAVICAGALFLVGALIASPLLAQDSGSGYVGNLALELAAVIPPPPTPGSAEEIADRATYKASLPGVGSEAWSLASKDVVEGPGIVGRMQCAIGRPMSPEITPITMKLLGKAQHDLRLLLLQLKQHYDRPRPYADDAVDAPLCENVPPEKRGQGRSYPSGHAAESMLDGYLLASLLPDRAAAILTRARQYGDERVICRVHNPSDVRASQLLAGALFSRLQSEANYQHDWKLAQKELAAVKRSPLPGCRD